MINYNTSHLDIDPEEKERLLKEIQDLKDEIASMKSSSLLGDHQPKDIVRKWKEHTDSSLSFKERRYRFFKYGKTYYMNPMKAGTSCNTLE